MRKAVIECGGVQYLVAEGDTLTVNFVGEDKKTLEFTPLMIVDGKDSVIDASKLKSVKVAAKVEGVQVKGDKVVSIRYKAKKRVNTKRGHRQSLSSIKVTSIQQKKFKNIKVPNKASITACFVSKTSVLQDRIFTTSVTAIVIKTLQLY